MNFVIDSNIWIEFFNRKNHFDAVSQMLLQDCVYINKIILAELIPQALVRRELEFVECLSGIELLELDIDWNEIVEIQVRCIKAGINKLGLLDIAIAQNARQNGAGIFTIDKNMVLLCDRLGVRCRTS
jgi:predicted nucleic acid-binding protein